MSISRVLGGEIVSNQLHIRTIIFYVTISSSVYIPLLHQATSDIRITLNFTTIVPCSTIISSFITLTVERLV